MDDPGFAAPSDRFLIALGALTLNWASIEAGLDFACATIFHELPYPNMDKQVPQALGRKISLLRRGLKHPKLDPIRGAATALLDDIAARKDDRHNSVHGAVLGASTGDEIATLRVKYVGPRHVVGVHTTTAEQLEAYASAAQPLAERAVTMAVRVFNIAHPQQPISYPLGEFAA